MSLELEFTVEPFEPGRPGPHVRAAEEAAGSTGGQLTVGPFGTLLSGEREQVLAAVDRVMRSAIDSGATRVTLQVSRESHSDRRARAAAGGERVAPEASRAEASLFVEAVRPVVEALGAQLVAPEDAETHDVRLVWEGTILGAVRPPGLHGALDRMLDRVADELGEPLAELSREQKQLAVQLLDEREAFNLRKSVEEAAQALQVSRFTVYNYLNRISNEKAERAEGAHQSGRRISSSAGA